MNQMLVNVKNFGWAVTAILRSEQINRFVKLVDLRAKPKKGGEAGDAIWSICFKMVSSIFCLDSQDRKFYDFFMHNVIALNLNR